jgi:hypothetical protein
MFPRDAPESGRVKKNRQSTCPYSEKQFEFISGLFQK